LTNEDAGLAGRSPRAGRGHGPGAARGSRSGGRNRVVCCSDHITVNPTGETRSHRWRDRAFAHVRLDWRDHVRVDTNLMRPADVRALCGDASRAKVELGWEPRVDLEQLVAMMVEADLARVPHTRG
jgi:nucleoside-diphosphate-sugar epimerase